MNPWTRKQLFVWYSISSILFGVIAFAPAIIVLLSELRLIPSPESPFEQMNSSVFLCLVSLVTLAFFLPWSLSLLKKACIYRKQSKDLTLSDVLQNPQYDPYVLYFRSLNAELKMAQKAKYANQTEEELIVHSFSPIGKTVAIGCPSDPVPPLGGCRIEVPDDQWQQTVKQLSEKAKLTALYPVTTEGVSWEINYTLSSIADLQKLIILIPDIENANLSFFASLEKAIQTNRPDDVQITPCYYHKQGWGSVSSIIYFEKKENGSDGKPSYIMKQSFVPKRTKWNYFGNLSLAFQKAMFPVYNQFGKLSFLKIFSNAALTYFFYVLMLLFICCSFAVYYQIQHSKETWCLNRIQKVERKYPKFAENMRNFKNPVKIDHLFNEHSPYTSLLNDEDLIEFWTAYASIYKRVHLENKSPKEVLMQLPQEELMTFINYILISNIMYCVPEKREDNSVFDSPEDYQDDKVLEVCSSLTEEQKTRVRNWLSIRWKSAPKQKIDCMELINEIQDQSIKAFLIRAYFISEIDFFREFRNDILYGINNNNQ